jgi:hypothetical protein
MIRTRRSSLMSAPLVTMSIAAFVSWGCGGSSPGPSKDAGKDGKSDGSAGATGTAGGSGSAGSTAGTGGGGASGTGGQAGGGGGSGADGGAGTGGGGAGTDGGAGTGGGAGGGGAGTDGGAGKDGGVDGPTEGGTPMACTPNAGCTPSAGVNGVCNAAGTMCSVCATDPACVTGYGAGRICVSGSCVTGDCHQNADCSGKICTNNTCTSCQADPACVTAYGANHLCQSGVCVAGNCHANGDCANGRLCDGTLTCVDCTTDASCTTALGAGHLCISGGCVTGTCRAGADCTNSQICVVATHTCGTCTDDNSCQTSYGAGRICVGTSCIVGTCRANADCSNGQACVSNGCVNCTGDTQCTAGQICLGGACLTGDCRVNGDCSGGKACITNSCAACTADTQCGTGKLCVSGACVTGDCRASTDCTGGLVCLGMTCSPCTDDGQCGSGHVCVGSTCIPGDCHTTANCSNGKVCDPASHACSACGGATTASADAQCAAAGNYGAGHFCQTGACVAGQCRTPSDCSNGQLCDATLACVACASTQECITALGTSHQCVTGACVGGNCTSTSQCTATKELCTANSCSACANDSACLNDVAYGAQHLCLSGQCTPGNCRTSTDCVTDGQVCNTTTHVCEACSADATCKSDARYGSTRICLTGLCTVGDCHDTSTECPAGQLCGSSSAHTCGGCSGGDGQCTADPRYGANDICYQGTCSAGNCHATSMDCTGVNSGLICGASATNVCGACVSDGQCKSDSFYGNSKICNTTAGPNQGHCVTAACAVSGACAANGGDFCCGSLCTAGNCCSDADCGAIGTACVNNVCSACNLVSGNKFFVDPINGNDSTGTGSGFSGTTAAAGCAFKTIARAITIIGATPPAGTKIVIVGKLGSTTNITSATETLPIILPANVTLTTQGGPIKITLLTTGAGNPAGLRFLNNNSGVTADPAAPLTLDGNGNVSGIGILVNPATATNIASVSNVTIQNTGGDGIRVSTGVLNIGAGVVVTGSSADGLRVLGTIVGTAVTAAGVANIVVPAGQSPTMFSGNVSHGIEVTTGGSVNVTGAPGAPVPSSNGTVVVTNNTAAGLRINQTSGTTGLATSTIDGLVAWANPNYGARLFTGSLVKVRNSIFLANGQYGVLVSTGAAGTAAGQDLSKVDLGTPGSFGKNYLQTPLGALGTNASGGICVGLSTYTGGGMLTEVLPAAGNFMVSGTTAVDCSTSTATITRGTCGGFRSAGVNAAVNITTSIDASSCL